MLNFLQSLLLTEERVARYKTTSKYLKLNLKVIYPILGSMLNGGQFIEKDSVESLSGSSAP